MVQPFNMSSNKQIVFDQPSYKNSFIASLYENHHYWLTGWLSKKLGCSQNASDLTHDTFVNVISKQNDLTQIREPRPWLLTIAKRLLIDKRRRFLLEQAYLEELKLSLDDAEPIPSTEDVYLAINALSRISEALETLPSHVRQAFILRHIDGLTQSAIAQKLGVSTTMVQKYLIQSLVACQQAFETETF
ncbi:putative sigma-70 factor, ECF subfamily [Methylophaga aminisulfidivorans MP]|uniref:Putative sigma-70 factor, ECF subfamily n=2 Tax=Methylophaga aminisulfidivorans TaxID=230105 RepID=F5SZ08_9GAMM|nr:putative sigma-70 factor, ECF subfamily [Methylophaga aminisulfidivorans MP]